MLQSHVTINYGYPSSAVHFYFQFLDLYLTLYQGVLKVGHISLPLFWIFGTFHRYPYPRLYLQITIARNGPQTCSTLNFKMRFREFDNNPTRSGIPSPSSVRGGQVPCVPAGDCRIKYGLSVYDIALFGVVGHCRVLSATRYVTLTLDAPKVNCWNSSKHYSVFQRTMNTQLRLCEAWGEDVMPKIRAFLSGAFRPSTITITT